MKLQCDCAVLDLAIGQSNTAMADPFEKIFVVTTKGKPVSVNLPYSDILNLIDIIDEMSDPETLRLVKEHRDAVKRGAKFISATKIFEKIRKSHKKKL